MNTTFELQTGEAYKFYLEGYPLFATLLDAETLTALTTNGTKMVLPYGVFAEPLTSNIEIQSALLELAILHNELEQDATNNVLQARYAKHLVYTKTLVNKPITLADLQAAVVPFTNFATITTEIREENIYINFETQLALPDGTNLGPYMRTYQNHSCKYANKEECLPYLPTYDLLDVLHAQNTEKCNYLTFYSRMRVAQGVLYSNVEYVFSISTDNTLRTMEEITNTLIRFLIYICQHNYTH